MVKFWTAICRVKAVRGKGEGERVRKVNCLCRCHYQSWRQVSLRHRCTCKHRGRMYLVGDSLGMKADDTKFRTVIKCLICVCTHRAWSHDGRAPKHGFQYPKPEACVETSDKIPSLTVERPTARPRKVPRDNSVDSIATFRAIFFAPLGSKRSLTSFKKRTRQ